MAHCGWRRADARESRSMPEVTLQIESAVAIVTINRPHARNAVDRAVAEGLARASEQVENDRNVRFGLITAACAHFFPSPDFPAFLHGEIVRLPRRCSSGFPPDPLPHHRYAR